jgi:hypothetical protein
VAENHAGDEPAQHAGGNRAAVIMIMVKNDDRRTVTTAVSPMTGIA